MNQCDIPSVLPPYILRWTSLGSKLDPSDRQTDRHLYLIIKLRVVPSDELYGPSLQGILVCEHT